VGNATTMMKTNGPSHLVRHKNQRTKVMTLSKENSASALKRYVCSKLRNQELQIP
jgi:hypothetical protein